MSVSGMNKTFVAVDNALYQELALYSVGDEGAPQQLSLHPVCRDQNHISKTTFLFPKMVPRSSFHDEVPNDAAISRSLPHDAWRLVISNLCFQDCSALSLVSKQLDYIFKKEISENLIRALLAYPVVDTGSGTLPLSCKLEIIELVAQRRKILPKTYDCNKDGKLEILTYPVPKFTTVIMRKGLKFSDIVFALENKGDRLNTPLSVFSQQFENWEKVPIKKTSIRCISEILKDERDPLDENEAIETLESHYLEPLTVFEAFSYYAFNQNNNKEAGHIPSIVTSTPYSFSGQQPDLTYVAGVGLGKKMVIQPICINIDRGYMRGYNARVSLQGKMCLAPKGK